MRCLKEIGLDKNPLQIKVFYETEFFFLCLKKKNFKMSLEWLLGEVQKYILTFMGKEDIKIEICKIERSNIELVREGEESIRRTESIDYIPNQINEIKSIRLIDGDYFIAFMQFSEEDKRIGIIDLINRGNGQTIHFEKNQYFYPLRDKIALALIEMNKNFYLNKLNRYKRKITALKNEIKLYPESEFVLKNIKEEFDVYKKRT